MRYRAEITAGALKVAESRVVAGILLQDPARSHWHRALFAENALQARSAKSASLIGGLILARLRPMTPDLWRLVCDGSKTTATHACLAAAVKHSPLLGDFMDLVLRHEYRVFTPCLSNRHWTEYIRQCHDRDPEMPEFAQSTVNRLRSTVFQSLAQAGYLESTRTLKLQTVHFDPQVLAYLRDNHEEYVLRCIQVGP